MHRHYSNDPRGLALTPTTEEKKMIIWPPTDEFRYSIPTPDDADEELPEH